MDENGYEELLVADNDHIIELRYDDFAEQLEASDAALRYRADIDGRLIIDLVPTDGDQPEFEYQLRPGETIFFSIRPRFMARPRIRPWQSITAPRDDIETIVTKEPLWSRLIPHKRDT